MDSNLNSFLFKLLHKILPTAERVARILPNHSPVCSLCYGENPTNESLSHAMFLCNNNQGSGATLMRGIKKFIPYASESDILKINFDVGDEDLLFALVWSSASFLSSLWNLRIEKKRISLSKIRTDLEASVRLLRESRLHTTIKVISAIFD